VHELKSARTGTDEAQLGPAGPAQRDNGAERNRIRGRERGQRHGGVEGDRFVDLRDQTRLALGEVGGLLAAGVILVLRLALLAGRLVARGQCGPRLQGQIGLELAKDAGAEGGLVHGLVGTVAIPGVRASLRIRFGRRAVSRWPLSARQQPV
jgi:hypothetical protein